MLGADGGYLTVSRLVSRPNPSLGFETLWDKKRLDLSVEALILETEWIRFFDEALLKQAERKLRGAEYQIKRYRASTPETDSSPAQSSHSDPLDAGLERTREASGDSIPARKNSLSFSAHCARLGAPLANVLDRWCGISEANRRAVFSVWADKLNDGRYIYWSRSASPQDSRVGARELLETIKVVIREGYDAYGVLCEAEDPTAEPRKRKYFHEDSVLVLRFSEEEIGYVAYVVGEIPVASVIANKRSIPTSFPSAIDDLAQIPQGASQPDRVTRSVNGYRRDEAVRRFVLARAGGFCEYCGVPGFDLPNGGRYLEAHHVIALADQGPDTVQNVIALCAHHHREAHFGRDAERLEASLIEKLKLLQGGSE